MVNQYTRRLCELLILHILCIGLSLVFFEKVEAKALVALPGEPCQVPPLMSWTKQERWVWERICVGKVADLSEREGARKPIVPSNEDGWTEGRNLLISSLNSA